MATTQEALDALLPEDCHVLAAAAAGLLTSDSRFVGTINELRWHSSPTDLVGERVPMRQHRRLRNTLKLIKPSAEVEHKEPPRVGQSLGYTVTKMQLTPAGVAVIAAMSEGIVQP
jgi:hypothetical protein